MKNYYHHIQTVPKQNLLSKLMEVDLNNVVESEDLTDLQGEIACAGGMCEVDSLVTKPLKLEL